LRKAITKVAKYRDDIVLPRSRRDFLSRKEEARSLVRSCLERFNAAYGLTCGKVSIKDMRRNWGSCSESGNLNFNYKIIYLPTHLAEYLVVHELCHLGSFDHSPAYWALVAREIPDHRERRKELRRYHP
jgi:predicted metal-dependent hydrolase